jgi:hypothetical protein
MVVSLSFAFSLTPFPYRTILSPCFFIVVHFKN